MSLSYRLRQGWGRLKVSLRPDALDLDAARAVLPAQLWSLFAAMPRGDQWHGLCVLARLRDGGWDDPDLVAAALLHDLGKAEGRLSLAYRTMIIISNALGAAWVARLAVDSPSSWRYPFYVHLHHAALGAARLTDAGANGRLVSLVETHGHAPHALTELGRALAAADDAC